jgi:hypothetical protein
MRRTTEYSLQLLADSLPPAILLHVLRPYMVKQRNKNRRVQEACDKCGKLCWPYPKYKQWEIPLTVCSDCMKRANFPVFVGVTQGSPYRVCVVNTSVMLVSATGLWVICANGDLI